MAAPTITYSAKIIQPGTNLTLTGEGTQKLTATYSDFGGRGEMISRKANCTLSIEYKNVTWVTNSNQSVTVSGEIVGATLQRTKVADSTNKQEIWAWFNNQETFHQIVDTGSTGTYNLNLPSTFSVTIPATPAGQREAVYPASIHFKNWNTVRAAGYYPDEFALGLLIQNNNDPNYRPGKVLNMSMVWLSHNRSNGAAKILTDNAITYQEMRTDAGSVESDDAPFIRNATKNVNMRKIGQE